MGLKSAQYGTITTGEMRSTATFANNAPIPDGAGGQTDNYTVFYTCRGRLREDNGGRALEAEQLLTNKQFELVVRYTTVLDGHVTASTKVTIDGDDYSVKNMEKVDQINHFFVLTICKSDL